MKGNKLYRLKKNLQPLITWALIYDFTVIKCFSLLISQRLGYCLT